jgi:hypothetical protein
VLPQTEGSEYSALYMAGVVDQDRRPAEDLRLLEFATASTDSAGNWAVSASGTALGQNTWPTTRSSVPKVAAADLAGVGYDVKDPHHPCRTRSSTRSLRPGHADTGP